MKVATKSDMFADLDAMDNRIKRLEQALAGGLAGGGGGGGTYLAGAGLALVGSTFDVNVDNSTLEIISDILRVKNGGITSAKIADGTIVDSDISAAAAIGFSKLGVPTAAFSFNSQRITNLGDPTAAQDAVTRSFLRADAPIRKRVHAATTGNISLSGDPGPIDSVGLSNGFRILVKNQTTASQNGIYIVNLSGAWTRADDASSASDFQNGMIVNVAWGDRQFNTLWQFTGSMGPITIGSTAITFQQIPTWLSASGALIYNPSTGGLTVNVDDATIERAANALRIKDGGITSAKIADGTITDGDISATAAIALAKLATNPLARANHTGTQLAATISDFDTQVRTSRLDQMSVPTLPVSFSSQRITNLGAPTGSADAATKGYVDNIAAGLSWKQPVRVATTANIALSGTQTIDGIAVVAGDRVLVKNQTTASQNGIYIVAAGAWSRSPDGDSAAELEGAAVFVRQGSTQQDQQWVVTTDSITLGSTEITWALFGATVATQAGAGLVQSGNALDVNPDNATVEVSGDQVRVKDGGITAAKIAAANKDGLPATPSMRTLGGGAQQAAPGDHTHPDLAPVDSPQFTGEPTAPTPVAISNDDQIATTAFVHLALASGGGGSGGGGVENGVYAANYGDGIATEFLMSHDLGSKDLLVEVRELGNSERIVTSGVEIEMVSDSSIRIVHANPPDENSYRVLVSRGNRVIGDAVVDASRAFSYFMT